ncbi:Alcohol dehydrogenase zinc-binding domain-containing protein [Methylacidimicrobium sp. AP8]|uniref:quinone oxidoreductase family protein n=1 Tax=Methylacidimicrobium sp. AP8 TaxID=2730359 RepID=UPI0018C0812A|nr:zinc-binding alcohol dehydrogenase family protein [Methylacidimicrobium sp. AP8]CAB4244506.1 Alcohol dehydrogenase zinc-binding domain-containing protein [Methylacidimicrobium sp. AP8]
MKLAKAYSFSRYGGPEVLTPIEIPVREPLPDEVLIRVAAIGINPSDVKNVAGYFGTRLPRIPGRDFAGVIVAGAGRQGEEVWGSGPGFGVDRDGAFVEYLCVPSSWVGKKPSCLSMEAAAAVGVPYVTAWSALIVAGGLMPEETVLIVGAAGAVGRAAIHIARWRKARVIAVSRSASALPGADDLISAREPDWPRRVVGLTEGKGVDLALDTIGGEFFEPCLKTLRTGGRQLAIASHPPVVSFNLVDFFHGAKRLIGVDSMALRGEEIARILEELRAGFEEGELTPPSVRTWPFASAKDALSAAKARPGEKQVLVFDPS